MPPRTAKRSHVAAPPRQRILTLRARQGVEAVDLALKRPCGGAVECGDSEKSRCGYADVSSFSTVFKRWAQVTPREYRSRFGLRS